MYDKKFWNNVYDLYKNACIKKKTFFSRFDISVEFKSLTG